MERPVVPLSWYAGVSGAAVGSVIGHLVPMAAWVAFGPFCGFVRGPFRLRKVVPLSMMSSAASPRESRCGQVEMLPQHSQ